MEVVDFIEPTLSSLPDTTHYKVRAQKEHLPVYALSSPP
jgi:hypothetical protein